MPDRKVSNYIEQEAEATDADQAIRAHLRQACEHKIALHVDAAIDVVDTDPVEADAWAYEAGQEAWEFDLQAPEKLSSHPALSAAFKRGFESIEQLSRSQRDVSNYIEQPASGVTDTLASERDEQALIDAFNETGSDDAAPTARDLYVGGVVLNACKRAVEKSRSLDGLNIDAIAFRAVKEYRDKAKPGAQRKDRPRPGM